MARNFRVQKRNKSKKLLCLQLFGDFDGASADHLFCLLHRKMRNTDKVTIDTNGLRNVNTFGIDVFRPKMARLTMARADIAFTGKFRHEFHFGL